MLNQISQEIKKALESPSNFALFGRGLPLRNYQREPITAIAESVLAGHGRSFCVVVSRQGGKNHMQAELQAWLLLIFSGGQQHLNIVVASPTYKPQTENAIKRLITALESNKLTKYLPYRKRGYIIELGNASITFLSAEPGANVVGATANLLLMADEAQDILPDHWRVKFLPMASSTNATICYFGTIWTDNTLLDQEIQFALESEKKDGVRRVFSYDCNAVALENPAYGKFVQEQVARLGRESIAVKTQFYLEKVQAVGGMFTPARLALMQGNHFAEYAPSAGMYAVSIDFGGNAINESGTVSDATALTVARVILGDVLPQYEIVYRKRWRTTHDTLYKQILAVLAVWNPSVLILDAGGVGAGLSAMLAKLYPSAQLIQFTATLKSWLGYRAISAIETGRIKEHKPLNDNSALDGEQKEFWRECQHCEYEIKNGVAKIMSWGVPNGKMQNGEPVHDDLITSALQFLFLDNYTFPDTRSLPSFNEIPDILTEIDNATYG